MIDTNMITYHSSVHLITKSPISYHQLLPCLLLMKFIWKLAEFFLYFVDLCIVLIVAFVSFTEFLDPLVLLSGVLFVFILFHEQGFFHGEGFSKNEFIAFFVGCFVFIREELFETKKLFFTLGFAFLFYSLLAFMFFYCFLTFSKETLENLGFSVF